MWSPQMTVNSAGPQVVYDNRLARSLPVSVLIHAGSSAVDVQAVDHALSWSTASYLGEHFPIPAVEFVLDSFDVHSGYGVVDGETRPARDGGSDFFQNPPRTSDSQLVREAQ